MKKVNIDLNNITGVEKAQFHSRFNNPMYNLHFKGTVRFYTSGKDAVVLTHKDGLRYMIGSQRADELLRILRIQVQSHVS